MHIQSALVSSRSVLDRKVVSENNSKKHTTNPTMGFATSSVPSSENLKAHYLTPLSTEKTKKIGFGKAIETHLKGIGPVYDSENGKASLKIWAPTVAEGGMELQIIKIPVESALNLRYNDPKMPEGCITIPLKKEGDVFTSGDIDISRLSLSNANKPENPLLGSNSFNQDGYKVMYRLNITKRPDCCKHHYLGAVKDPRGEFLPEGASGWNEFVDHKTFDWGEHEKEWNKPAAEGEVFNKAGRIQLEGRSIPERNKALASLKIYECHVGTMTKEGTFDALIKPLSYNELMSQFVDKGENLDEKLKTELVELDKKGKLNRLSFIKAMGYNAIEFMPVNQFPGKFGWGYDTSDIHAIQHSYGGPEGFKDLVKTCHKAGLNVFQDVQHNHEGPEEFLLNHFAPYIKSGGEFGGLYNFDTSDPFERVRDHFVDASVKSFHDHHIDGIRYDYTKDMGLNPLRQISEELLAHFPNSIKSSEDHRERFDLSNHITPDDPNIPTALTDDYIPPRCTEGSPRLCAMDMNQWNSDAAHTAEALVVGEKVDAAEPSLNRLSAIYKNGFTKYSNPLGDANTVEFIISHDEKGNHDKNLVAKIAAKDLDIFNNSPDGPTGNKIINALIDSYINSDKKSIMSAEEQSQMGLRRTIDFAKFDAAYKRAEARRRVALAELAIRPGGPKMINQGAERVHNRLKFFADLSPEKNAALSNSKKYDAGVPALNECKLDNYGFDSKKINLWKKLSDITSENEALTSGKRKYADLIKDFVSEGPDDKVYEVLRTNDTDLTKKPNNEIFTILNYGDKDYKEYGIKMTNELAQPDSNWRLSKGIWEVIFHSEDPKYSNHPIPEEFRVKEGTRFIADGKEIILPLFRNSAIILKKISKHAKI